MKLIAFRVSKYRNIQDSGQIDLLDDLTCIVGKNQSGKTALLRALHKFNPHEPEPYNINREWPRGERRQRNPKQIVCEVTFRLSEQERAALAEITSKQMTTDTVVVTKDYEGNFEVHFPGHDDLFPNKIHPNSVDDVCKALTKPAKEIRPELREEAKTCRTEVRRLVREGRFTELAELPSRQKQTLDGASPAGATAPIQQQESTFIESYIAQLKEIVSRAQELSTMQREAHDYVVSNLPTFIYMDDFREFEGTAILDQVQARRNKPTPNDETFLMILELAGLDLDQLVEQGASKHPEVINERQLDLDDGASSLTRDVSGRWGQSPYRVEFRADGQTFLTNIEETGKEIGMIPLEEQSKGFRWFFSFDLRFMHDSDGTFKGCVLLLDEPGLHLHPGGQDDLLKRLDKYSEENTLIYTTHLPFLVDLREPARIRVISQTDDGAIVTEDLSASGPDEKLTLQAALGMKLSQHYLVAEQNLVVEGAHDYWIIGELSGLFERDGLPGIPEDVQITASGGAPEAVYMTTFMVGQGLDVVTLFDSDEEGIVQEEKLRKKWLTRYKDTSATTILLGDAMGVRGNATIEDLFPEAYYMSMVNQSHKEKLRSKGLTKVALPNDDRPLVKRVEAGCTDAGIVFNKGSVAKLIRKDIAKMTNTQGLDQVTRDRAKSLFEALRKKFPK
jgi:energy-coupling factor transporter ATP-binding protein EcfA2